MTYLVGHSGAGKSTLLKLIMGMEKANAGNIWFNGHDITRLSKYEIPFLRRQIGMVHQDYRLLTDRSVAENVALPLIIAGMNPKEAHTRALVALDRVGLRSKANYMPPQISGGEQQMLAMGRALMSRPKLLLLDEPSMGLAPIFIREIFKIIQEIQKTGTTVLLIEQNAKMALSISNRAYVLETGSVVLSGTGQELLESDEIQKAYLGG